MIFRVFLFIIFAFNAQALTKNQSLVKEVENYLNDITTLSADFIQVDHLGQSSSGKLYLSRPGKLRWEYAEPDRILIVVNNKLLTYYDLDLKQSSHTSSSNLVGFLARENINFTQDIKIKSILMESGIIKLKLDQEASDRKETINMILDQKPMKLKKIEIINETHNVTSIILNNIKYGVKLDPKLFYANQLENYKN